MKQDPRTRSHQLPPWGEEIVRPERFELLTVRENGTDNLSFHPLDGSPGRRITNFKTDVIQTFQFSLDGKTLGVMRTHTESDVVLLHDTDRRRNDTTLKLAL